MRAAIALALAVLAVGCKPKPVQVFEPVNTYFRMSGETEIAGIKLEVAGVAHFESFGGRDANAINVPIKISGQDGKTLVFRIEYVLHPTDTGPSGNTSSREALYPGTTVLDERVKPSVSGRWNSGDLYLYGIMDHVVEAEPTATFSKITASTVAPKPPQVYAAYHEGARLSGPREEAKTSPGLSAVFEPVNEAAPHEGPYIAFAWDPHTLFKDYKDEEVRLHSVSAAEGSLRLHSYTSHPEKHNSDVHLAPSDDTYAKLKPMRLKVKLHKVYGSHPLKLKITCTPATREEWEAHNKEYIARMKKAGRFHDIRDSKNVSR